MSTLTTIIQHSSGSLSYSNQRRQIKGILIGKEVKLLLFADDMILYIENTRYATRKLLELINENSTQDIKLIHRNPLHSHILTIKNQKE